MANKRRFPLDAPSRVRPRKSSSKHRPLPYLAGDAVDRTDTGEHIGLVEIDWDTGTEYYSFVGIQSPNAYYDDLVVSVSPIRREVTITGEGFTAGTATVEFHNRDKAFSQKWANTSIRGRIIRIKFVSIPLGLASALTLFTGKITNYALNNEHFIVEAKDSFYEELFANRISQNIPILNKVNFPNLIDSQTPVMAPIVMGNFYPSPYTSNYGKIPCFLVDTSGGGGYPFVYIVSTRPLGTGNTFAIAYSGSAAIAGAYIHTTASYNGHTYDVIAFVQEQRSATRLNEIEISCMTKGFTETDSGTTQILNPVRCLEYLLDTYTTLAPANFDTTLQTAAKTTATAQLYDADTISSVQQTNTPTAIWEGSPDTTWLDLIEILCQSFGMGLYTTRYGLFATFIALDSAEPSPDFTVTDENDIISESFSIKNNPEIATVLQLNHSFRWTYGQRGDLTSGMQYDRRTDYTIPGEKARIGSYDVRKVLDLKYNGSTIAATEVARSVAEFYKSQAQIVEFDLPISWFRWAELNRYVGITHWQGVAASGGYSNVTARIVGIETTVTPTTAKIHLRCFKRASAVYGSDNFTRADAASLGANWTQTGIAFTISSNRLSISGGYIYDCAYITGTFGNNQLARINAFAPPSTGGAGNVGVTGVGVRVSGTVYTNVSGYFAVCEIYAGGASTRISLYKFVNANLGTQAGITLLATATNTRFATSALLQFADLEIRVDGTSIEVWVISDDPTINGLAIGPTTDSSLTSGSPGIACWGLAGVSAGSSWTNFCGRDF